ncbi:hypothetical protein [Halostagnicola sp. A-GB9-2]|uniref:hypothetical protein n=1 Tax=Halostagnicola sp. A-GB9-2 TaxID=3048066 RepID=UPI0024BF149A|nr:hypothetical protein [Halostagnicola sp. A-GB9-2]MDJ1434702.1 hypothetical protein [Halostagnicola sp. A-GB9-2]
MNGLDRVRPHVIGEGWRGGLFLLAVIALSLLFSGGFVLEILDVGFSLSWVVVAFGIAIVAGGVRAGLLPAIGSLWFFAFWWYTFPPLVGYLTGDWEAASRYTYPRTLGYGYDSAYHELMGGINRGVRSGLSFALFVGTIGYSIGTAVAWFQHD